MRTKIPKCKICKNNDKVVKAVYKNNDKWWECERCWVVIKEIITKKE